MAEYYKGSNAAGAMTERRDPPVAVDFNPLA
jgi:hypothetical protein